MKRRMRPRADCRKRTRSAILHPMLKIEHTAKFLLDSACLSEKLLDTDICNVDDWKDTLTKFWERWRIVEPNNAVFTDYPAALHQCIPCFLHGDEGVGHRRKPVMQISWGSLLRVGHNALDRIFLITCCPHKLYTKYNKGSRAGNVVLDKLFEECARSALHGYCGVQTLSGHTFHLVFLGVAGDHPFQTKVYRSTRGHLKTDICPHCEANTHAVPFEDMSMNALWRETVFQTLPWTQDRPVPLGLMPGALHPSFIRWDLLHMVPHGCARNYVASVICMLAGPLDIFIPDVADGRARRSKDLRLEVAYTFFDSWLECNGKHVRDMKEFTKENLQWTQNRSYPDMNCKASDTTLLIHWLIDFLSTVPFRRSWVLETALAGLRGVDEFCRLAYTGDRIFWDKRKQKDGKRHLAQFLLAYVQLQKYWHERRWTLFLVVPKLHYAAHWHFDLAEAVLAHKAWAISPGAFATPMMEDFVGVTSRISRSVHPSSVPRNTIYKYLVHVANEWFRKKRPTSS